MNSRNPAHSNTNSTLYPRVFLLSKIYKWRKPRECDILRCSPRCQVGFRIWPATHFEFNRQI